MDILTDNIPAFFRADEHGHLGRFHGGNIYEGLLGHYTVWL
jgi:hypothetical protein